MSFQLLSIPSYVPLAPLAASLGHKDLPQSELSALDWNEKHVFMDEVSTFIPFSRGFKRTWDSLEEKLRESCSGGRFIVIRNIDTSNTSALENLGRLVDSVHSVSQVAPGSTSTSTSPSGSSPVITMVLEGFSAENIGSNWATEAEPLTVRHPPASQNFTVQRVSEIPETKPSDLPSTSSSTPGIACFEIQVSGKRSHTFYVNHCLKVFRRHTWFDEIELSGLGNAITSIVSIAEILKRYKAAIVKRLETSLVELTDSERNRPTQKAKIVVLLGRGEQPILGDELDEEDV